MPSPEDERIDQLADEGICLICEVAQAQEDDCMCAPCRDTVSAGMDTITDPVERILSDHWSMEVLSSIDSTLCRCGLRFDAGPGLHRRHVAQKVYEALGVDGPTPWIFGPESEMRDHPQLAEVGLADAAKVQLIDGLDGAGKLDE